MTVPLHAIETRTVTVRGVPIYTRSTGEGPTTIVLHGGPGAHHDYLLPHFDGLARGRRLQYYDQRGGGRSPAAEGAPVGWREHVADLDALIAEWGTDPATLLGYSWGGLLALLFACEHPDRVARLALVSPAPCTAEGRLEFERRFAERMRQPDLAAMRGALRASSLRERDPDGYRQRAFELAVAGYFADPRRARDLTPFRVTGRAQAGVWKSLGRYDIRERVAALSVPALVVHGAHDPIPVESARETADLLRADCVVFEGSGHVPYVEEYDRFVATLDVFLPADR